MRTSCAKSLRAQIFCDLAASLFHAGFIFFFFFFFFFFVHGAVGVILALMFVTNLNVSTVVGRFHPFTGHEGP